MAAHRDRRSLSHCTITAATILLGMLMLAAPVHAAGVFVRFKVVEPAGPGKFAVSAGGFRHADPWYLPSAKVEVGAGQWSEWLDVSGWPWHARMRRAGGVAEWPAMTAAVARVGDSPPVKGVKLEVQLADATNDDAGVVHSFSEASESATIGFLVPTPLREHAKEFETGSQMTARHLAWAKEASGGHAAKLKDFTLITALWGHYDPALARSEIEALKLLGFNVVGNYDAATLMQAGVRTYNHTWMYEVDPASADKTWAQYLETQLKPAIQTDAGRFHTTGATHYVIGDEVQTLDFRSVEPAKLNGWFREYLRARNVTDGDLGKPIDQVEYPAKAMYEKSLPRDGADLPTRRLMYHAAKFGHWWSAKQLAHSSNLIRASIPGMKTETLPSDHGFFHAWGPPHIGMGYRMLDLFELGAQRSVDQLSAEDWLGLNHMYGPNYTWTGAQTFAYFNAICRSAIASSPGADPPLLRGLITVSDDNYLRLKAYSSIGQGSRSFFFWTFGPTYIGTENYWSDLRSEYDGIAKLSRALEQAEPVLMQAKPVRDPVAILYSVSHDIWHTDDPAAFVEKRLLWHALRHLHVQPDFLREEDVEAGRLKDYKLLFVVDNCVTRKASAAIDEWTRTGGVTYLPAGAATRDEFYEPFVPPYAATVWPDDAAARLKKESHRYNERADLPNIKPMTTADGMPVIGYRLDLRETVPGPVATFADTNATAGATVPHGKGKVMGLGFLPMLAYGQGANFKPTTLEEQWPAAPREIVAVPLKHAGIDRVAKASTPVVETSLLSGEKGSALVLVNYTYEPIMALTVDVKLAAPVTRATSTEGKPVTMEKTDAGVRLTLPLEWTDIVLLQ